MAKSDKPVRIVISILLVLLIAAGLFSFFSPLSAVKSLLNWMNGFFDHDETPLSMSPLFPVILKLFGAFCLAWSLFLMRAFRNPAGNVFVIRGTSFFLALAGIANLWASMINEVTALFPSYLIVIRGLVLIVFAVLLYLFEPGGRKSIG